MIRKVLGTGRTGMSFLAMSLVLGAGVFAEAQVACDQIFEVVDENAVETPNQRPDGRFDKRRELVERVSIDLVTKQTRFEGFVKLADGRELYVDYLKPEPGQPIIVLDNGLTYRTAIWNKFVAELKGDGLGILRYDPIGMGETMKKYGPLREALDIVDQVNDQKALFDALGITQEVHVLGLSYGGGVAIAFGALYPKSVASLIIQAPLTGPSPKLDGDIRTKMAWTRVFWPYWNISDRDLYNFYLKQIVYATYPLSEPIVREHPYKLQSVYYMTEGTKDFRATDYSDRLPAGKVHLMVAGKDRYVPASMLEEFWNSVPEHARASRIILANTEHKIPEEMPHFSAELVKLIIKGDSRLKNGTTWRGGVWSGGVTDGTTKIEIK